jgi:hypothetical protein
VSSDHLDRSGGVVDLWRCPFHGLVESPTVEYDGARICPFGVAYDETCCAPVTGPWRYVPTLGLVPAASTGEGR